MSFELYVDDERVSEDSPIQLGEIIAPEERDDIFSGEPLHMRGRWLGETDLRDISVSLRGEGASNVQIATDVGGEPGVWAAPGESILIDSSSVEDGTFSFWSRGLYALDDHEGRRDLEFVLKAISTSG